MVAPINLFYSEPTNRAVFHIFILHPLLQRQIWVPLKLFVHFTRQEWMVFTRQEWMVFQVNLQTEKCFTSLSFIHSFKDRSGSRLKQERSPSIGPIMWQRIQEAHYIK
nr:hypothetical protein [Tanacetum cinerariifolium]